MAVEMHIPKHCAEARAALAAVLPHESSLGEPKNTNQLISLAKHMGVKEVQERQLGISGMLIPSGSQYVVVLNESDAKSRQTYSLAHEIGHLVADCSSEKSIGPGTKHRALGTMAEHGDVSEERFCESVAAELLMPIEAFGNELLKLGSSLKSVPHLAATFGTSITATTIRFCELLAEPCLLVRWRLDLHRNGLIPEWQIRNEVKAPFTRVYPKKGWGQNSGFLGPFSAYTEKGLKITYEAVMTKVRSENRQYVQFPKYKVESMGFGLHQSRFVMSVVYLGRKQLQ